MRGTNDALMLLAESIGGAESSRTRAVGGYDDDDDDDACDSWVLGRSEVAAIAPELPTTLLLLLLLLLLLRAALSLVKLTMSLTILPVMSLPSRQQSPSCLVTCVTCVV